MTTHKQMGRAVVLMCGALLAVLPAMAQSNDAPPPPPPNAGHGPGHGGHGKEMFAQLQQQLNITPEQSATVKAALMDEMQKMQALRNDTTVPPRDKRRTMMAAHQETDAKIKAVLSDEQKPKYEAFMAQRREEMRARRGAGGGPEGSDDRSALRPPPQAN